MKFTFTLCFALYASIAWTQNVQEKTFELPKHIAKKGVYSDHAISADNTQLTVVYEYPKFKAKKGESPFYKVTVDLNTMTAAEPVGLAEAPKLAKPIRAVSKGGKTAPKSKGLTKYLQTSVNPLNGQMKLMLGTITEKTTIYYGGGGHFETVNYKFNPNKEIKPKSDAGRKLTLIHSKTDYHSERFTAGGTSLFSRWGQPLSIGEGNAIVLAQIGEKPLYTKFSHRVYDASTLGLKFEKPITFECSRIPVAVADLPNGDFGYVFRPGDPATESKTNGKFKACASQDYHYVRISPKGEIVEDIPFKLPIPKFGLGYSLRVFPGADLGEVVIAGIGRADDFGPAIMEQRQASIADEKLGLANWPKTFHFINIKDGKVVSNNTFDADELAKKDIDPEKKLRNLMYVGDFKIKGVFPFDAGHLMYAEFGNRKQLFHFNEKGDFVRSYNYWLDPEKGYTDHRNSLQQMPNGTIYWTFQNMKDGDMTLEFRKIDPVAKSQSDVITLTDATQWHPEVVKTADDSFLYVNAGVTGINVRKVALN